VTVMFSDLVGSTALSARMEPEDLREVISAYQRCVAEAVHRFDGFVKAGEADLASEAIVANLRTPPAYHQAALP
jgi:class 3 adenylate cyclase